MTKTLKKIISSLFVAAIILASTQPVFAKVFASPTVFGSQPGRKIDNEPVDGMLGVPGSLSYLAAVSEQHAHSYERWFEAAATPSGETHVADRICEGTGAFQVDAGNNTWGAWVQILGSSDTPEITGSAYYNFHRIVFLDHERNLARHCIQVAFGTSGAAALSAGTFSEFVISSGGGTSEAPPVVVLTERATAGTKCWIRINIPGQNTGTLDFTFGIHEFPG